tara:strand:+ start:6616 stop:7689 length:1074 start_codon:yes stop_codon:yes gene_type:complete
LELAQSFQFTGFSRRGYRGRAVGCVRGAILEVWWFDLTMGDYFLLGLLLLFAIGPYIYSIKMEVSVALATVLSLLLVSFWQEAIRVFGLNFQPFDFLSLIPLIAFEPSVAHRWITAAWLHSGWLHVLSNILVIALLGVPLEQKLGAKRWLAIYFLGLLSGNIAWVLTHAEDPTRCVGASGAAFGLLGAYMACWPRDEVEFPLLFLIRAWPVWVICMVRLGLEVFIMYDVSDHGGETKIAHLAHVGGFFGAYLVSRPIARSGPVPLEDEFEEDVAEGMPSIGPDPWSSVGSDTPVEVSRILGRLRDEGDELETRRAWLEELADHATCPECGASLIAGPDRLNRYQVTCSDDRKHLSWP